MNRISKLLFLVMICVSCSGPGIYDDKYAPKWPDDLARVRKLWTKTIRGRVTDMKVASTTSATLVAAVPDFDQRPTLSKPVTSLYNRRGQKIWSKVMVSRVRNLDVSNNHQLTVLATYDENLRFLNSKGNEFRKVPKTFCEPRILDQVKKVICFYDDDTPSKLGFQVFSFKGRRMFRYSIQSDVTDLKTSNDQIHHVLMYEKGRIDLINENFQELWNATVPGEVIDVGISIGEKPKVAILYQQKSSSGSLRGQKVMILDYDKNQLAHFSVSAPAVRLDFDPTEPIFYLIGNQPEGQFVIAYSEETSSNAIPLWFMTEKEPGDFPKRHFLAHDGFWVGFEKTFDQTKTSRSNFVLSMDHSGKVKWGIPIPIQEGLFLFGKGRLKRGQFMSIVSNNSVMRAYQID